MKAVILAAGLGTRLRPLTDNKPKCMVEVNGTKIIEKQLLNLTQNGINPKDICVISGYEADKLENFINDNFGGVNIIRNSDYDKTNNMYSMYLAKDFVKNEEFILMNADVFYESNIITKLIEDSRKNLMVCDDARYIEESMKIIKKGNMIEEISKKIEEKDAYGVTIDVYKFSKEANEKFVNIIVEYIEEKKDLNSWTEVAINELIKKVEFDSLDMKFKWVEIDNHEDLKQAEELFA